MITFNHDLGYREAATQDIQHLGAKAQELFHIIDVRTTEEYDEGHIPDALNIPLHILPLRLSELQALAAEKPLLVHCEHGIRSKQAAEYLLSQSIHNIINMTGGFCLWENSHPVE